jgi:uncharacterized membrane protein YagU involved in acid resistance
MKNTKEAYLDNEKKEHDNIKDFIRAIIEAYKAKYVNEVKTGFEIVILDRVVVWKKFQKKKKSAHFVNFFLFSLVVSLVLIYFNFYKNFNSFYYMVFVGVLMGLIVSIVDIIYTRGMTPIRNAREALGFKKAINDLYFETYTSTQLEYYKYIAIYFIFLFLIHNFSKYFYYIDILLYKIYSKIALSSLYYPKFVFLFEYIIYTNLAFIITDLLFVYIYFRLVPKKNFI